MPVVGIFTKTYIGNHQHIWRGLFRNAYHTGKQSVSAHGVRPNRVFIFRDTKKNDCDVDNDRTLENIAIQAVNAVEAGADIIAPSGMMDGTVEAIRSALNQSKFNHIPIMAYSSKFASGFYGPFRDAAGCSLGGSRGPKDRKTYQMDPANRLEALRETEQDILEGADMVMVKPGLSYLDVIREVKDTFQMPTFAYNVSGEYAMLKFAAQAGAIDYDVAMMEMLLSFKRAGADGILTDCAIEAAELLKS